MTEKHKYFTMGTGENFNYVGFWFPLTGKNLKTFPEYAKKLETVKPDICNGVCSHCGTNIVYHHIIADSNGSEFAVGSECIKKLNDTDLDKIAEETEVNALKEQKKTLRDLLDEKERDLNNGSTNKEMRKKLSTEIQNEKQKERIKIASLLIDLMKTFRFVGNKKKPLWQYSDSVELRSMLNDVKYMPNDLFWTSLKNQFIFYYQTNVIGDNTKELNEKLACFEKLKEKFNSDLLVIEKNTETKMEEVKKKYK